MKSITRKHILHVIEDVYIQYMIWALWATGIVVVLFTVSALFFRPFMNLNQSALTLITNPAQIFMFVLGIITGAYLIQYYVRMGVTRRSFYVGTTIAGFAVALSTQLIGVLLTLVSLGVEALTPYQAGRQLATYLGTTHGYPMTILISTLLLSVHFFGAWIIGFTFYRFRFIAKTVSIIGGIILISGLSLLWDSASMMVTIRGNALYLSREFTLPSALMLTVGILLALLGILYRMIKESPVKMH